MNQPIEQSNNNGVITKTSKKGGKRPGAGRKRGKKTQKTLEREAVLAAFRQRAMGVADQLLSAQLSLAKGQSFLYCIKTVKIGRKSQREKPVLITDEGTIAKYLNGELDHLEDEYYYITAKEPLNPAIDSILDRTFGKATQPVEGSMKGEIVIKTVKYGNNTAI